MTATTPTPMQGTEAPNQLEYLYERYRHLIKWVLVLLIAFFAIDYVYKWQAQSALDAKWTQFSVSIGMDRGYSDKEMAVRALTDLVEGKSLAELESAASAVSAEQKPFVLLAVARRAMIDREWDRAESALSQLESGYPKHSFVTATPYPIQVRAEVKKDDEVKPTPGEKPELEPAVEGSIVQLMRKQIEAARDYQRPARFEMPAIPADAPKVRFELSEGYGSFTIALMTKEAPEQCAKFLELARSDFWKDFNVDEVHREGTSVWAKSPMEFHLGFASTKEADRDKWNKTDESENQIEFEESGLSHFPGAVAARVGADGKSCVDRFWVCGEDNAMMDGQRVVFGFVVEGLENVETVCKASMNAQEEEMGRGTPSDNITVVGVTVLE